MFSCEARRQSEPQLCARMCVLLCMCVAVHQSLPLQSAVLRAQMCEVDFHHVYRLGWVCWEQIPLQIEMYMKVMLYLNEGFQFVLDSLLCLNSTVPANGKGLLRIYKLPKVQARGGRETPPPHFSRHTMQVFLGGGRPVL